MSAKKKRVGFSLEGLAETIRFLLCYGELDFTDEKFSIKDWPDIDNISTANRNINFPFPTTEQNKKDAIQSMSIIKHLGKLLNLAGRNELEELEICNALKCVNKIRLSGAFFWCEKDPIKKLEKQKELINDRLPLLFNELEALVVKNQGHLALGRLTWCDFYFASYVAYMDVIFETEDFLADYPNLVKLRKKIGNIPQIKKLHLQRVDAIALHTNNKYKLL